MPMQVQKHNLQKRHEPADVFCPCDNLTRFSFSFLSFEI